MGNAQIVWYLIGLVSFILIGLIFYLAGNDKKGFRNILSLLYVVGVISGAMRSWDYAVVVSVWFLITLVIIRIINYIGVKK